MITIAHPLLGAEEEAAALRVLASGRLAQGEHVAAFERRFAELCLVREAVAVSSGTAALHLALLAHDIGHGDEVITTAFSFVATANVVLLAGATPVFVDQAHAATIDGRPVGSFGTGCFSFYAIRNMTTGEGGMVTTNDPALAERVRLLRNHGQEARYYQIALGYNLRMTELQAALGVAQIEKLEYFTERRIANAAYLTERLKGAVQTPVVRSGCRHVYHQYTIKVSSVRNEWADKLHAQGIETVIQFPFPIHQQPFYRRMSSRFRVLSPGRRSSVRGGNLSAHLPATESAAQQVLSLPVHPALRRVA